MSTAEVDVSEPVPPGTSWPGPGALIDEHPEWRYLFAEPVPPLQQRDPDLAIIDRDGELWRDCGGKPAQPPAPLPRRVPALVSGPEGGVCLPCQDGNHSSCWPPCDCQVCHGGSRSEQPESPDALDRLVAATGGGLMPNHEQLTAALAAIGTDVEQCPWRSELGDGETFAVTHKCALNAGHAGRHVPVEVSPARSVPSDDGEREPGGTYRPGCTDPPEKSCEDAGCPVHGWDGPGDDDGEVMPLGAQKAQLETLPRAQAAGKPGSEMTAAHGPGRATAGELPDYVLQRFDAAEAGDVHGVTVPGSPAYSEKPRDSDAQPDPYLDAMAAEHGSELGPDDTLAGTVITERPGHAITCDWHARPGEPACGAESPGGAACTLGAHDDRQHVSCGYPGQPSVQWSDPPPAAKVTAVRHPRKLPLSRRDRHQGKHKGGGR